MRRFSALLVLWGCAWAVDAAPLRPGVLDDFRNAGAWSASASDQVRASLRRGPGRSLCLDADFGAVSGYAVMRRELPVRWPAHFDLTARLQASGATNDFQLKLVDASGDNVWWVNRPNFTQATLPATLADMKIKRRHVDFAWGPATDRTLRDTRFIELVIAAGRDGGRTSVCVSRLSLQALAPEPAVWPEPVLRHSARSTQVDLGVMREFNGLAVRWPAGVRRADYTVAASSDGRRWRTLRRVQGSDGGLDALFLPESEARHLRVQAQHGTRPLTVELRSVVQWPTLNTAITSLAADAPRGELPRAFAGEQNYWALVGVDGGGERSALMSEDGALEVGRGGYSVEPAVQVDGAAPVTWADVTHTQSLRERALPLPAVRWQHAGFTLDIEAAADGPAAAPELLARYVLRNTSATTHTYTLVLAVRPWQVNPPQQFLSTPGGARHIDRLRWSRGALEVGQHTLRPAQAPQAVTALPFDGGLGLGALLAAPALHKLHDPQRHASAALTFSVRLPPGGTHTVAWTAPLGTAPGMTKETPAGNTPGPINQRFEAAATQWRQRLTRVTLQVPASAQPLVDTLRTSLAHILMSRDGPALRPGTRSYARTWVRDGAMMVAGLVRVGETGVAREFVDWYAERIFESGKVPCCVDQRGADPVAENDSHGQYLYAVAEVWRHTRDTTWLARHWPRVQQVTAYQESLRQSERTDANRTPERAHLFGLLPPSISHEGYSDKAAFSYWDNFWGLRGYKDAALMAQALGHSAQAQRWAGWRDEFERELLASMAATATHHGINFIAGAADRGDFDATSTTVALNPAQAAVPPALLAATFERYWQETLARSEGRRVWKDYTPYELRNVGALVRLGQPERAHTLLRFFFADQRPPGWNQWAEVVLPNPREVRFLGDMPHAWVSSDYIRSALDLLVYEREEKRDDRLDDRRHDRREGEPKGGHTLLIGAGVPAAWLAEGWAVRGLSTPYGLLDFSVTRAGAGWVVNLPQALHDLTSDMRLVWPGNSPLPAAHHNGQTLPWQGRELPLPAAPAQVQLTASGESGESGESGAAGARRP